MNKYVKFLGNECTDLRVVNSARVSFNKHVDSFDSERDTKLINYLAKNGHWTPFSHSVFFFNRVRVNLEELLKDQNLLAALNIKNFEAYPQCANTGWITGSGSFYALIALRDYCFMSDKQSIELYLNKVMPISSLAFGFDLLGHQQHLLQDNQNISEATDSVTFRIKMPIFVARQWFKHQIGFSRNEVSRRYVSDAPEFWDTNEWRLKADNKKQGSSEELWNSLEYDLQPLDHYHPNELSQRAENIGKESYQRLLDISICPEQARTVLPQSMYTEFYETASIDAYKRLISLRCHDHAQKEIRDYAEEIKKQLIEKGYEV